MSDLNDAFRRVAAGALEVAAQELDAEIEISPDATNDPGRKWAVRWLQKLSRDVRNGEGKDHDAYVVG